MSDSLRGSTSAVAWIVGLALVVVALPVVNASAAPRNFAVRFQEVATGGIAQATNVLSTCGNPPSAACVSARSDTSLTSSNSALNNNAYDMVQVDVDSDPSTSNSSSAVLDVPDGAAVLWAGLYWTASAPSALAEATAKAAKLQGPLDSGYRSITASVYDSAPSVDYGYDCFADVTDLVRLQGEGAWTFGGIPIRMGRGTGSGWSLIVAYSKPGLPLRDLAVFDGQIAVSGTNLVSIPVSGFRTPAAGTVKSDVGFMAFEGDRSASGDYLQLNDTILTDAAHPANNTFNSWIAKLGALPAGRNPAYSNQLGFDSSIIAANGILPNNATSAVLRAKTNGDAYMPVAFTFATDLYSPIVTAPKTVVDLNGGEVRVGDELQYEVTVSNSGDDGAVATLLREDAMPSGTDFVPGSLEVDPGAGYTPLTDAAGDDLGEAEGGNGGLVVRLGQGADADNGGLIAKGKTWKVRFKAKVASLPPAGGKIVNVAAVDFASQTLGSKITVESNEAALTVRLPDASISKRVSSALFDNGIAAAYTITVKNVGDAPTDGETVVTDELPAGFTSPTVTSSTGWSCSIVSSKLECRRSDPLSVGGTYPSIVISSPSLDKPVGTTILNAATVESPLDSNATNDVSIAGREVGAGLAVIPVSIAADVGEVLPGNRAEFTASFYNTGPSAGPNPVLTVETDALTAVDVEVIGFTVTSSDGSITAADCTLVESPSQPIKVTCSKGTIAAGVSVEIGLVLSPRGGTTETQLKAKATSTIDNDPAAPRTSSTTVEIVPTADLGITKTASVASIDPGESVTFTMKVTNSGPAAADRVRVVDVVPAGLTVETATWSLAGGASDQPCQVTGQVVECSVTGQLASTAVDPGASVTVTIVAKADSGSGPRVNRASVAADTVDLFPDNDVAEAQVVITPWAGLGITKSGPASLKPGGSGTFRIVVSNSGPSNAANVTMTDTMPAGLEPDPADPLIASGTCSISAPRTVTCLLINDPRPAIQDGVLAVGETWVLDLRARVSGSAKPGTVLTNSAVANSDTPHDAVTATDEVRVTVATVASKRLGLSITGPRSSTPVGRSLRISVKVTAPRSTSVSGVSVCVALPANVRYVRSSGRRVGGRICWTVGTLRSGASRTWSIVATARSAGSRTTSAAARGSGAARVTDTARIRTHSFTG